MLVERACVASALATVTWAAQPGAVPPVEAPIRDLEWGTINFLHTTDTHGWHGGHLQEPQYGADWGDYVSFASHMRRKADEKGVDLIVIDTGDRIEGNGLYDASDPKGKYTSDVFREQAIDVICTGNHELYYASSVEREHDITVPNFKHSYLASNLDYVEPQTGNLIPQARRYRRFTTKQGLTVVAFGFLFDFERAANNSRVQPVEDALKEAWFQKAIRERPDLFIVAGHIGLRMKEFDLIYKAIRDQNWHTPIVMFGGHAHVRDARVFDDKAFALASGRYMETIGWMAVDGLTKRAGDRMDVEASLSFHRRYIDNNLFGLHHHTGLDHDTFPTDHGRRVTKLISDSRKELGLDRIFGCAPQDLWTNRAQYPSNSSVFTWLEDQVLPDIVVRKDRADVPRLAIINTGLVRFDIFQGPFTVDSTYLMSPFINKFNFIPGVPYKVASKVLTLINDAGPVAMAAGLDSRYLVSPEQWSRQREQQTAAGHSPWSEVPPIHTMDQDGQKAMSDTPTGDGPALIPGYTTTDDAGDDGDDTVHEPIDFYNVPNCIQAEIAFPADADPDTVDLVFIDYVQPWILAALRFGGGDYSDEAVQQYVDRPVTDAIVDWISRHWKGSC